MTTRRSLDEDKSRLCWVCFATDEDDRDAAWVKPCRCRGTTMWVHQNCLQRWIDEKQKGNSTTKVACPQCNTEYIIVFPDIGTLIYILDLVDNFIYKSCPFVAGSIFFGSVYWSSVTYGAITVMQVLGHKEGLNMMEGADPLFLLIGLPMIPVMLVLCKIVRWEDRLLRLWRERLSKWPIFTKLFPSTFPPLSRTPAETVPLSDPISITRALCGALVLPTIATVTGKAMFGNVSSNLQRTLLGGFAFVVIKGLLKIYYKQNQYIRQANRVVRNYEEPQTNNELDNNRASTSQSGSRV